MKYIYRDLEFQIRKYINKDEIIAIIGVRQCGKTTLLRKIFSDLKKSGKKAKFISFDSIEVSNNFDSSLIGSDPVYIMFTSPSGKGLKVVVKIPAEVNSHRGHFLSLEKELSNKHWDNTSINISRACFDSYDPDIFVNVNAETYTAILEEIEEIDMSGAFGYEETEDMDGEDTFEYLVKDMGMEPDDAKERTKQQGKDPSGKKDENSKYKNDKNFIGKLTISEIQKQNISEYVLFLKYFYVALIERLETHSK